MDPTTVVALIGEIVALIGVLTPFILKQQKLVNGMRCQLRSDMLSIYYRHKESGKMRQYEHENFVFLYEAYKALGGNSFIDKIYKEVVSWEVVS